MLQCTDDSVVLMEHIENGLNKLHEMLRSPIPKDLSELRLKLAVGAHSKAPPVAHNEENDFAMKTKEKVCSSLPSLTTRFAPA